jgi:hypothetical protein
MGLIQLLDKSFFKILEEDAISSVGVSLSRNNKIVTARTIKSVRAVTVFTSEEATVAVFGSEGLPFIIKGKPANTKLPVDFVGTETKNGRTRKVFELKQRLKDWKAVIGYDGSDYYLAKTIAENERKPVDIASEAIRYLEKTTSSKVLRQYRKILVREIIKPLEDE